MANSASSSIKSGAKNVMTAVVAVMAITILIVISALIIGTILAQSVFSSLTIINVTDLEDQFGAFVTALIGFFAVIGVIIAIVWLVSYIKPLFDKKDGVQSFAGS